MKPTSTSHVLRKLFRDLESAIQVDYRGFVTSELSFPKTDQSTSSFSKEYLAYNIGRKRETSGDDVVDPSQMRNALQKWSESERRCQILNDHGRYYSPIGDYVDVISTLKQRTAFYLSQLLCDVWPDLSSLNHTSGASADISRKLNWSSSKYDGTPSASLIDKIPISVTCVPAAHDLLKEMLLNNPGIARRYNRVRWGYVDTFETDWSPISADGDESNVAELCDFLCQAPPTACFTYVPKDVNEVRLIAKSSSLTISVQKTFGDAIRNALKGVGVDLNDQRVNQEWAEIGSYTGLIATVDLSAASDSISLRMLDYFPPRWREYFLACRDTHVAARSNGPSRKLAMIAGMGNGFIFELESALFWAFSMAVTDHIGHDTSHVSVYGDDIIVPSAAVPLLADFLLYNGFLLNEQKSFWGQDPFRESCGKHYHNGVDVTPVYLKGNLESYGDYFHLTNGLSEWSDRTGHDITGAIRYVFEHVKPKDRHVVPCTWSSRSGFHSRLCSSFSMPIQAYRHDYQRLDTVYTVNIVKDVDVTNRCGTYHLITASLQALDCASDVVDVSLHNAALPIRRAFRLYGTPYEVPVTRLTWLGKTEQKQRRSESFVRDA